MKLKSRGLGRKELTMDFREYTVVRDGDEIMIVGTIREPVHWDFTIRMCEDDLAGVAKVAMKKPTIALLLRAAFKRNKNAHWSVDRKTQIVQAKEAHKELLEKQAAKAAKEAESGDEAATPTRSEARKARKAERKAEKAAAATQAEAEVEVPEQAEAAAAGDAELEDVETA